MCFSFDIWIIIISEGYICVTIVDENSRLNSKLLHVCLMKPLHR